MPNILIICRSNSNHSMIIMIYKMIYKAVTISNLTIFTNTNINATTIITLTTTLI